MRSPTVPSSDRFYGFLSKMNSRRVRYIDRNSDRRLFYSFVVYEPVRTRGSPLTEKSEKLLRQKCQQRLVSTITGCNSLTTQTSPRPPSTMIKLCPVSQFRPPNLKRLNLHVPVIFQKYWNSTIKLTIKVNFHTKKILEEKKKEIFCNY